MYSFYKRFLDFVFAFVLIIILLPLFIVLSILIKIDSKGPIFFIQDRVGQNNQNFNIFKFRSMKVDTPNLATDKLGDPTKYITRVGYFLRKSSLDELPQLINIFKGEMSFIGPRPALYNQYELIEARDKVGVNSIKPGLTGYAQVMGRDYISNEDKVRFDQYYVEHMSFIFDIKIIIMTLFSVLKGEGINIS